MWAFRGSEAHIPVLLPLDFFLRLIKIALSWNFPGLIKVAVSYWIPDSFLCSDVEQHVVETYPWAQTQLCNFQLCDFGHVT